jgi:hypothetical protein
MKNPKVYLLVLAGLALAAGCDAVRQILGPSETSVRLVNDSDFPVEVDLYYGDEQDTIEAVLTETGTNVQRTIDAGDIYSFSDDCDNLQAIVIVDADLRVLSGLGPEDSTDVLRDGTDFSCGDTITFTFDHSAILTDFAIHTSVD